MILLTKKGLRVGLSLNCNLKGRQSKCYRWQQHQALPWKWAYLNRSWADAGWVTNYRWKGNLSGGLRQSACAKKTVFLGKERRAWRNVSYCPRHMYKSANSSMKFYHREWLCKWNYAFKILLHKVWSQMTQALAVWQGEGKNCGKKCWGPSSFTV